MRLHEQIPDLEHCWIRYAPRPWPGERDHLWMDLAARALGRPREMGDESLSDLVVEARDDLVYLPPVASTLALDRHELAERLASSAVPLLVQELALPQTSLPSAEVIFDVLHAVATGDLEVLSSLPPQSRVVWPLVAGYTDDPATWQTGLERLVNAGVTAVFGVVPELSPGERRRIVEVAGEAGFDRLFHGPPPEIRPFAVEVHRRGLEAIPTRPVRSPLDRTGRNRLLAGQLATIAELWLRLGRAEAQAQAFFRAARWIDRDLHDLAALAREGNLGIVSWLDSDSRRQVEAIVDRGSSALLDELLAEYLASES